MLYLAAVALMSGALLMVLLAGRAANRPGAPAWLRNAVLGNGTALTATALFGAGLGMALQAAFVRGDAVGAILSAAVVVLPFVGLWLLVRMLPADNAALEQEAPSAPTPSGSRPRRGRTGARAADAARHGVAAGRKAG